MQNKKTLTFSTVSLISLLTISMIVINTNYSPISGAYSTNNYSLILSKDKNKFHNTSGATPVSGTANAVTELGNEITYTYLNVIGGGASTWHVLSASDSYFYNQDPLSGLDSITLSFKTDSRQFKVYWSNSLDFDDIKSQTYTSSSSSSTVCNFGGYNPNYVKVENLSNSNLNISNVSYTYSCINQYYSLSRNSDDTNKGTVSGDSGLIKVGTEVSVTATPNTGYYFDGWYSNGVKVSSEPTYSFDMPLLDIDLTAKFIANIYSLSLSSNDENKGTVSGSGDYAYLSNVTVTASPKQGYKLDGWYNGLSKVSTDLSYTFQMPYDNLSLVGKFVEETYTISISSSDETLGTVSGSGNYLYKSSVTLTATPKTGCHFVGWYDGDTLISTASSYTFDMPYNNLTYVGVFEHTLYSLTVTSESELKGTVSGSGNYIYQEEVLLTATPNIGYVFFGWYKDGELLSRESSYTYAMPLDNVTIVGKFSKIYSLYIESDDTSKGTVNYPSTFVEGFEVTIEAIPNSGYTLNYWYNEDFEEVSYVWSYTFTMPSNDVTLFANFVDGEYKVNVIYDSLKGTVKGDYDYLVGRTVILKAEPLTDYVFNGWYSDSEFIYLVSSEKIYSFIMPSSDKTYYARFLTKAEEEEWKKAHGVIPTISSDEKTITYGMYPQTNVNDTSLISTLNTLTNPNEYGYYFYNNEYYYKYSATPYQSGYTFDNGTTIVSGTSYWFKVEPIKWVILDNEDGTYFITTESLLVNHIYNSYYSGTQSKTDYQGNTATVYANNYKYSDIRSWLNTDFYDQAFFLDNDNIKVSIVDNSVASTLYSSNQYACEDTNDKLFLLSAKELTTSKYGFATSISTYDTARQCKTTDYARAHGVYATTSSSYENNGYYYTRSPYYYDSGIARSVGYDGYVNRSYVSGSIDAVRLALRLSL